MDPYQNKAEQEHRDFLRKVANDVYDLIRCPANMARFQKQAKIFCEKNEEHEKEMEQLKKDSEVDTKLRAAIKKRQKELWGKTWDEMTEEEREEHIPPEDLYEKLPTGYENCVWYLGWCVTPPKTHDLWEYLTPPPLPTLTAEFGPRCWEFLMPQNDNERLICSYAMLTALHERKIFEKPIYTKQTYSGNWRFRDTWIRQFNDNCKYCETFGDEGNRDTRDWIKRALMDVKTDLARIGKTTVEQKTESYKETINSKKRNKAIFKAKDRDLFFKIAKDIKIHSDKYRPAGEWLNQYYDGHDESYWKKRKDELAHYLEYRKLDNKLKGISDEIKVALRQSPEPIIAFRLALALEDLMEEYEGGGVMDENCARSLLIITWLVTDPEADKTHLNLTKFANLPWKTKNLKSKGYAISEPTRYGLAPFLFMVLDITLYHDYEKYGEPIYELNLAYLPAIHAAWTKLVAEKNVDSGKPTKTEQKAEPVKEMVPSKKERILNIIKNFRECRFCGPSDDPDEQTAVTVGYHYLVTQLKKTATPFLPEDLAKSLNSIKVEINNLFSVYEARAEIDALLPDIERKIQGIAEHLPDEKSATTEQNAEPVKEPKKEAEMPSEHDQIETFDNLYLMLGSDLQEYGCVLGQTNEAAIIAGISIRRKYAAKGFSLPEMPEKPTATKLMDWCTTCQQTIRAGKPKPEGKEKKTGRKIKNIPEKIENMMKSYDKHLEENKGVKYAWECVAEEHGFKSAKAAEMAVRRHQKQNK